MMRVRPLEINKLHLHLAVMSIAIFFLATPFMHIVDDASAQSGLIQHQIVTQRNAPPTAGREFWWAIPSNFFGVNTGGKYLGIYITSAYNTTAYIGIGQTTYATVPVTAYKVSAFTAPEAWEMETSGDVQDNAVHVWSKDADLTVYFMSHNYATSDGTYVIPMIGLGTDYVIAGFEALFEGGADDPSEFTIAASLDNTTIQITPSCDLRGGTDPTLVAHPQGETFQITLNRGQSVQFMSVQASGAEGYDVTGTVIHSSEPVGVIGGSMCTNIPVDFQYCDHVEHMLPPVRTWGETYYSTFFTQPPGASAGHDAGLYLFVSSKPNQTIWHHDQVTGTNSFPPISSQYGIDWEEMELAQKFWSDAPFMVVEYINSASYPDGTNGAGDPAEVVIDPREQYTKTAVFQASPSGTGQQAYDNYATITVNVSDVNRTTFDGKGIKQFTMLPIDDTFEIFTVPNLAQGAHVVAGDSAGVGVYVYGYGLDESYAWSGPLGIGTFQSPDTAAPVVEISGACYDAFVHLSDIGVLQSKLNKIQVDSDFNMTFTLDSDWSEGVGLDTSGYGMSPLDRTMRGYLQVNAYDVAGNVTMITSTYQGQSITITPAIHDFGTVAGTGSAAFYDTITNMGETAFTPTEIKLALGNQGFTLENLSFGSIRPGEKQFFKIVFQPIKTQEAYDTILIGDECSLQAAVVEGNAGSPDFTVDDQSWINEPFQKDTGWIQLPVVIHNKSVLQDLGVKFDSVSDPTHFYLAPYQKDSVTVPKKMSGSGPDGLDSVWFIYQPTAVEQDVAKGYWHSPDVLNSDGKTISMRNDSLHGNPSSASVSTASSSGIILSAIPDPVTGPVITFEFASGGDANITLAIYDLLGHEVARPVDNLNHDAGSWQVSYDVSKLPSGTYTYRLSASGSMGQTSLSKQFAIQR